MSYSNSYYSVTKAQFERPTIPPILRMAQQSQQLNQHPITNSKQQQQQQHNANIYSTINASKSSKSNKSSSSSTKLNSILSLHAADAEKKYLRQKKLLQEHSHLSATSSSSTNTTAAEISSGALPKKKLASLATAFPGFYLNPNETNYVKLINSILNSKLKPSMKLQSREHFELVQLHQSPTKHAQPAPDLPPASTYTQTSTDLAETKCRSNSCLNMNSIYELDEESSNMMFDAQSSSLSLMGGLVSRSKTDFDLTKKASGPSCGKQQNSGKKSTLSIFTSANAAPTSNRSDMNYRLSNSYRNGLSKKFLVSRKVSCLFVA